MPTLVWGAHYVRIACGWGTGPRGRSLVPAGVHPCIPGVFHPCRILSGVIYLSVHTNSLTGMWCGYCSDIYLLCNDAVLSSDSCMELETPTVLPSMNLFSAIVALCDIKSDRKMF